MSSRTISDALQIDMFSFVAQISAGLQVGKFPAFLSISSVRQALDGLLELGLARQATGQETTLPGGWD